MLRGFPERKMLEAFRLIKEFWHRDLTGSLKTTPGHRYGSGRSLEKAQAR